MRSLRARLFVSFVAVMLVMVTTTATAAIWPVAHAQRVLQQRQLEELTTQLVTGIDTVYRRPGLRPLLGEEIFHELSERTGTRLLIMDSRGTILADSGEEPLPEGTRRTIAGIVERTMTGPRPRRGNQGLVRSVGRIDGYAVAVAPLASIPDASLVVLAATPARLLARTLLPGLGLAVLAGLSISLLVTWFLSRSIARPIAELASVADAIASGDLDREAKGEGPEEVSRLVRSFNAMVSNLRRLVESQRTLLTNVAHELRTPLTVIQGYAHAVREGLIDDAAAREEALRLIVDESERAARLLTHLLQLTRLESGQVALQVQPVPVASLVQRVLTRHRRTLAERRIALSIDVPESLTAAGDPDLLEQAVENVVQNAILHGGEAIHLRIMATLPAGERPMVRLTIQDTGPGIPPHVLPHVFERFTRGPSEHAVGFGLGLAIVREIVQVHGGNVTIASEPGRGTTVTLALPAYVAHD